jgi:type I restriction enzyme S subunit
MKTNIQTKKIEEICRIVNGGTPDTKNSKYWDGDNFWVTPKDLGQMEGLYIEETLRKISDLGLRNSSAKLLPIGSLSFLHGLQLVMLQLMKRKWLLIRGVRV